MEKGSNNGTEIMTWMHCFGATVLMGVAAIVSGMGLGALSASVGRYLAKKDIDLTRAALEELYSVVKEGALPEQADFKALQESIFDDQMKDLRKLIDIERAERRDDIESLRQFTSMPDPKQ